MSRIGQGFKDFFGSLGNFMWRSIKAPFSFVKHVGGYLADGGKIEKPQ